MRTLLKVSIGFEAGDKVIVDGTFHKILQSISENINPECTYFYADNGKRTFIMVFDMKDSSEIPSIAEPLYMGLNATVDFFPVMNTEDLQKGIGIAMESLKK